MPTPEIPLLINLGYIVVTAAAFAFLGKLIRMPSIVSYIIAGIVLGPMLGLVSFDHSLELIAELGIALLLFLVGLELSLQKVRDLWRVALILGGLQILLTAIGAFALSLLIGFNFVESIFLGMTATFSSTVVVIKLLDQKGETSRLYARLAIALFLAQDLVVICALTILSGLSGSAELSVFTISKNLFFAFGGMAILLVCVLAAARYALPKPFAWAARSPDTIFIWALCWCFLVVLLAHVFHLSVEIGAFLAGIAVAQLPIHEDLHRRLHPLMTFFIAVFLVALGIKMEFGSFAEIWPTALGLSVFVLVVKPLIIFGILSRIKFSEYTAFQTSVASGQVSEFAFILLGMGAAAGLIEGDIVSLGGLVGITTIAASSYLIIYSEKIYHIFQRLGVLKLFRAKQEPDPEENKNQAGHIIVIGMNALGREIVQRLCERGESVIAIDTDLKKLEGLAPAKTVIGNVEYESLIREIGLREAKLVISALQIEDANHLLAYRCRSAGVRCAIHVFDVSVMDDLIDLETDYLISPALDGVVKQRELLKSEGVLAT
ncbi:MAG: cation:proton antiporter [Verrucomicrobiota bacterium]